jgi:methylamine dehydrogenase accessory protein MauD
LRVVGTGDIPPDGAAASHPERPSFFLASALAAWSPVANVTGWWFVSYAVLWIAVAGLGVLVVALAREVGALHLRLGPRGALEIDTEGPDLGTSIPALPGIATDGRAVRIGGPGPTRLYLFASPTCGICRDVLPAMPALLRRGVKGAIVAEAPVRDLLGWAGFGVDVVSSPEAVLAYAVPGTPYAVVLDERGTVLAKGTPNDPAQLEGLLTTARRRTEEVVTVP